ncbi:MAG TPA: glycosyltransferase family 9 protein [Candidatus Eisenbacteria bacterium]|nr:glycosyltransferase family 9 protein [Candidatus Eisenbacteria bacterium]
MDAAPRRIHLYRPHNQLGDLLLNVPAIRAVRDRFRDARVTLIVGRQNAAAVLGQPWADEVRIVETKNFSGVLSAALRRGRRPDLAIYFTTVSYSRSGALLAAWSGARERVGFDPSRWGARDAARLTRVVPYPEGAPHQSEISMALSRAVGAVDRPAPPYFIPDPALVALAPEGVVYLHPGAGKLKNRWPAERFAAVARELTSRGRDVRLLEGPQDSGTSEAVVGALGRPLPVVRGETIPQLAARFARAALYVGNDTGPLHLAGAVGAPTVGIYGWTDPREWSPVGRIVRAVRAADARLESIDPGAVLDVALPLLATTPTSIGAAATAKD